MPRYAFTIASWCFMIIICGSTMTEYVTVRVTQGLLRGRKAQSVQGGNYYSFQSVPFAQPPVGPLRFKAPQPVENWNGTRDALSPGQPCLQFNLILQQFLGSEDCLSLNVYTPKLPDDSSEQPKLPVMVWIHGGGFAEGTSRPEIHGPDFIVDSGVILVTINYRLGVLGFLSTGDAVASGNFGLKDQVEALRWVHENIANFGGNPENVTLSGVSSGAASVVLHMLSPMSNGLFQRGIAMGGSPLNPWSFSEDAVGRSFRLGQLLGLETNDSQQLVDFLRTQDAVKFPKLMRETLSDEDKQRLFMFGFVPSIEPAVDGAFLTECPEKLLSEGRFRPLPFLTGLTSTEGKFLLKWTHIADDSTKVSNINANFVDIIGADLRLPHKEERQVAAQKLRDFYFGEKNISSETFDILVHLLGDLYFKEGVDKVIRSLAAMSRFPIYYYRFSHEGTLSPIAVFSYNDIPGASHGEDGAYLFNMNITSLNLDPNSPEQIVRSKMVTLWTNFMKTGNPTPHLDEIITQHWQPYSLRKRAFLDIQVQLTLGQNQNEDTINFWRQLLE